MSEDKKRAIEATAAEGEAKKVHIEPTEPVKAGGWEDQREKGVAPIKKEFIVDAVMQQEYDDDAAEGGDREEEDGKKGKKRRGQNKKRDLKQGHGAVRLCSHMIDPENPKECKFGDKCKDTHDVEYYLSTKPADIEGVCPVYEAIGYCPAGLKCRWLGSHYDGSKLLKKAEVSQIEEINKITNDAKFLLQRKKYPHDKADPIIKFLDSKVQNHYLDSKAQNDTKNKLAEFVEAPFSAGEKKPLNLKGAKIVSPLTTVGNLPYRRLMKTLGADVTYSEMALTNPLLQGTNAEWALPKAHKSEYPGFGVQIATGKHWAAAKATEVLAKETPNLSEINLNCGCPIDLLYKQGQGSALLDQPPKLIRILKGMNYCSGEIPVTVKIRTGTRDSKNTAKTLVKRLVEQGDVAAITLHGRSRQQRYSREADWAYIGEVAEVVKDYNIKQEDNKETNSRPIQFVGNGDVYTHEDWYKATSIPGVDSVMVARGALIKPWIFEEVEAQQYLDKSATERLEILKTFANFALEHWGTDEYGISLCRRFMCEFLSFTHRYIPVGILERLPPKLNQRPPKWRGRNELETLLGSDDYKDWIKITEMFFGKAGEFNFTPKHKSNSYEK